MSAGPIKRERDAWIPPEVSTPNAVRVCAPSETSERGYCGRRNAKIGTLAAHNCADCTAALRADRLIR